MLNGPTQLLCDYKKESLLAFKNLFSFHVFICSLHLFIYILVYIPWDKQWDIYSHPVVYVVGIPVISSWDTDVPHVIVCTATYPTGYAKRETL